MDAARGRATALVLAGLAVVVPVYLFGRPWDPRDGLMIGAPFGRDFANFWLGGRLALEGSLATLTEPTAYGALIARRFAHDPADVFLFSYPPHVLLPLAALACLPYGAALLVWTGANLAALAAATRLVAAGWGEPGGHGAGVVAAACLSPAALIMVIYGHFGGLLALALAGTVTQLSRRPGVAGLCLAALSFKPQLGLVVGLALLAAGRWRCVAVGAVATALVVAASAAVFGLEPWRGFLAVTLPEQGRMLGAFEAGMLGTTISPYLAVRAAGLPDPVAVAAQALAAGLALAAATRALRALQARHRDDVAAPTLCIALAAVTALPYANGYDLALVAPALTPIVLADRSGGWGASARLLLWMGAPLAWDRVNGGLPIVPLAALGVLLDAALARAPRREPAGAAASAAARGSRD